MPLNIVHTSDEDSDLDFVSSSDYEIIGRGAAAASPPTSRPSSWDMYEDIFYDSAEDVEYVARPTSRRRRSSVAEHAKKLLRTKEELEEQIREVRAKSRSRGGSVPRVPSQEQQHRGGHYEDARLASPPPLYPARPIPLAPPPQDSRQPGFFQGVPTRAGYTYPGPPPQQVITTYDPDRQHRAVSPERSGKPSRSRTFDHRRGSDPKRTGASPVRAPEREREREREPRRSGSSPPKTHDPRWVQAPPPRSHEPPRRSGISPVRVQDVRKVDTSSSRAYHTNYGSSPEARPLPSYPPQFQYQLPGHHDAYTYDAPLPPPAGPTPSDPRSPHTGPPTRAHSYYAGSRTVESNRSRTAEPSRSRSRSISKGRPHERAYHTQPPARETYADPGIRYTHGSSPYGSPDVFQPGSASVPSAPVEAGSYPGRHFSGPDPRADPRAVQSARAPQEAGYRKPAPLPTPLKIHDPTGRTFSFPYAQCKNWGDVQELIRGACGYLERLGPAVMAGMWELTDVEGNKVRPEDWESHVRPGWELTLGLVGPHEYIVSGSSSSTAGGGGRRGDGRAYYR